MIRIRDYDTPDFENLWQLDQRCFKQGISYGREELTLHICRKTSFTLVAEDGAKAIGFLIAAFLKTRKVGHIITIDVDPDYRHQRVGSKLMGKAEKKLAGLECKMVRLEVAVDNSAAIAFYKRHGYNVLKTIPRYYLASIDALVMAKALSSQRAG